MQNYFPYSQIISSLCSDIKQTIDKHVYTGDWHVYETSADTPDATSSLVISELYY